MKILCVMDSHIGELHNLVPMFFHWGRNGELNHCHIDFVYIGHVLNESVIRDELNILKPFVSFELTILPIVSPKKVVLKKLVNFFRLGFKYVLVKRYVLRFIPYDQRNIFNSLFKLGTGKLFGVPHTTGDEVYSEEVFKERRMRSKKGFPVLAKTSASNEYFKALGFDHCIVTGKYFECDEYLKLILPEFTDDDNEPKLCVFSLSRYTKMFSEENWFRAHQIILESAYHAGYKKIYIKLHPSQLLSDLDDLFVFSRGFPIEIIIVSGHPSAASMQFDLFLTILTSAGQHALALGKPVCCFACKSMRAEVAVFGNDPYPYMNSNADEVSSQEDLDRWFANVKIETKDLLKNDSQHLLSLEGLINSVET